ncbi:DUF4350 domain-containing protein [Chloroflexota bacterium]
MRLPNALLLVLALALATSLACIWFYPSFQDFLETNSHWNGLRTFTNETGAVVISSLDNISELSDTSVLIIIPGINYNDKELDDLKHYVDNGGNLLLMDDYNYGNTILSYLGINTRFTGKPLLDPLFCDRNQFMPRITDFRTELNEVGISVITLNHATTLSKVVADQAIAWSSNASFLDINNNGVWEQNEPKGPFVVASVLTMGKGTIAIVSDPSIVINNMFGKDDNREFLQYLTQNPRVLNSILISDNSHLVQTTLDKAKIGIKSLRKTLSNPFALLGIIALIFTIVFRYNLKKGETVS